MSVSKLSSTQLAVISTFIIVIADIIALMSDIAALNEKQQSSASSPASVEQ